MHIVTRRKLVEFWRRHPLAEGPLRRWFKVTEQAAWQSFADVRSTFASADQYCRVVVFNIGGNKYRLVAAIHFNRQKVFVIHVLTHAEYSRGDWKANCE